MFRAVLDILFPRRCVACRGAGWPFCHGCREGIVSLVPPGCRRCGRPFEAWVESCPDCPPPGLAWIRSPFLYEGPVREAVMALKFGGNRTFSEAFAAPMAEAVQRAPPGGWGTRGSWPSPSSCVVTWVPLGRRRKRARGFDQAEMLARGLGTATGLPVRRLLERVVETAPQARRSGQKRRAALSGAFRATRPTPPTILLVDDVLTSGATATECARTLLRGGARRVGMVTAARAIGGPLPTRCYTGAGLQPGSVVARERSSR